MTKWFSNIATQLSVKVTELQKQVEGYETVSVEKRKKREVRRWGEEGEGNLPAFKDSALYDVITLYLPL